MTTADRIRELAGDERAGRYARGKVRRSQRDFVRRRWRFLGGVAAAISAAVVPAAAVATVVGLALRRLLVDENVPSVVRLAVIVLAVLAAYTLLLVVFYNALVVEVKQLIRQRRGSQLPQDNAGAGAT